MRLPRGQAPGKLVTLEHVVSGLIFQSTSTGPWLTATAAPATTATRNQLSVAVTGGTSPYVAGRKTAVKLQ